MTYRLAIDTEIRDLEQRNGHCLALFHRI